MYGNIAVEIEPPQLFNAIPYWLSPEEKKSVFSAFEWTLTELLPPDTMIKKVLQTLLSLFVDRKDVKELIKEFTSNLQIKTIIIPRDLSPENLPPKEVIAIFEKDFSSNLAEMVDKILSVDEVDDEEETKVFAESLFKDPKFVSLLLEVIQEELEKDFKGRNDIPSNYK